VTVQSAERLIYEGEEFYITSEPLSSYLKSIDLPSPLVAPNTACWRGYHASWVIDNKKLFLVGWTGYILDHWKVGIDYLFPGKEIVFAEWFDKIIRIDLGNPLTERIYEGTRFLQFEKGILISDTSKWLTKKEIKKLLDDEDKLPF
jgi:hypothetical protein